MVSPAVSRAFWIGRDAAVPPELAGAHVAIGNFDGMHRGHHAVIAAAREAAHAAGRPALALTFEPHPRSFFRPGAPVFRLTPPEIKLELLARQGLDGAVVLPFDAHLAGMEAEDFIAGLLVGGLRARAVAVGYDFHFGRARRGSPGLLQDFGPKVGLDVSVVGAVADGTPVSASRVREELAAGRIEAANALLGWRWMVRGHVIHGDKRGRTLGYPTANLQLPPESRLAHGIYAVRVGIGEAAGVRRVFGGVASYGRRPTFDNGAPLLEVFVFDFEGELYGQELAVEFLARLRGEERFESVAALVGQMDRDSAAARAVIAAAARDGHLSLLD